MIKKLFFSLPLICLFPFTSLLAINGSAINGNWNSSSTWLFNGVHRLPTCSDTLTIPSGVTVTVNSQETYTGCSSILYIIVGGTLSFTNGNKLDLPCFSTVKIHAGGTIKKATAGGGNSTLITICGTVQWSAGNGPLNGPAILGGGSPLPVSLVSFNAGYNDNSIKINWTTATEINNNYFILEHSADGKTYSEIAKVTGAGNSNSLHTYNVIDKNYSKGINYYRLWQFDYNGIYHAYPAIAVKAGDNARTSFNVYAISQHQIGIINTGAKSTGCRLVMYDISGKQVYQQNDLGLESGSNTLELSNTEMLHGIYFISIIHDDEICSLKLLFR